MNLTSPTATISSLIRPDFESLEDTLLDLGSEIHASEIHGLLCGQLCAGQSLGITDWLRGVVNYIETAETLNEEEQLMLASLFQISSEQFQQDDFSFELLLPKDEKKLDFRVAQLSQWCQGFLAGFGLAGTQQNSTLSADVKEILKDMADISQADFEVVDNEEDEKYYAEITEYLRMSAILIYLEVNGHKVLSLADVPTQNIIH